MSNENKIYKDLRDLEEKQFTVNYCGELLKSHACDVLLSVSFIENRELSKEKVICKYKAENVYASLMLQYKLAQILSQPNEQNIYYAFTKSTKECEKSQKGVDFIYHIQPNSKDLYTKLVEVVKISNKNAIQTTKNLIDERKIEIESKKVADDTLQYFLIKSQKEAVKEFEKTL